MLDNDDFIELLWFNKAVINSLIDVHKGCDIEINWVSIDTLKNFERKFDITLDKLDRPDK